ncbi:MAG: ferritin-like domain-containing protein [Pseudohongiellaceae bacterium]|nr:ferritin-like domain-containing protein [Pseudohongiellaceae bacterium]
MKLETKKDNTKQNDRYLSLYEVAKAKSWNCSTDIAWERESERPTFPFEIDTNPLRGFEEYENLSTEQKAQHCWLAFGVELSDILLGEQAALLISAQLIEFSPSTQAKLFLSSQVYEEARHVDFFSRYISQYIGNISAPSPTLKNLVDNCLSSSNWFKKYLTCHALIESLAMAKFQQLRKHSTHTILSEAMSYILRDEARHVGFGTEMLKEQVASMSKKEQLKIGNYLIDSALSLGRNSDWAARVARTLHWHEHNFRLHTYKHQRQQQLLGQLSIKHLALTMRRIGLWDKSFETKIQCLATQQNEQTRI